MTGEILQRLWFTSKNRVHVFENVKSFDAKAGIRGNFTLVDYSSQKNHFDWIKNFDVMHNMNIFFQLKVLYWTDVTSPKIEHSEPVWHLYIYLLSKSSIVRFIKVITVTSYFMCRGDKKRPSVVVLFQVIFYIWWWVHFV